MFKNDISRQQAVAHAARGHEGSMRLVLDDIHERLEALEAGTAPPAAEAERSAEVPLDERIKIAIRALPPTAFGTSGKPNVAAIEGALDESITAEDRDRVWAAMQEESA